MKIQLSHTYADIISVENLLSAWKEFLNGKKNKKDVQEFSLRLMDNILSLHNELRNFSYKNNSILLGHVGVGKWGEVEEECQEFFAITMIVQNHYLLL